jgi:hypothetical protein
MTKRLQAVSRNAAPDALPQNVNATNSTRAQFFCEDISALCAHSWLGELPPEGNSRRAWIQVFFENRRTVFSLAKEAIGSVLSSKKRMEGKDDSSAVITPLRANTIRLTIDERQ